VISAYVSLITDLKSIGIRSFLVTIVYDQRVEVINSDVCNGYKKGLVLALQPLIKSFALLTHIVIHCTYRHNSRQCS
jgi:hypothetical protein